MADISKIKTLDGTTYNLKDATARSSIPAAATTAPKVDGTAAIGSSTKYAKEDHVHPIDTSRAAAVHTHSANNITSGYLNIHPENNPVLIPFIHNDIASLLKRGGSAILKHDGVINTKDISSVFDGSGSYLGYGATELSTISEITIELTLHKTFAYSNWVYIDFGTNAWRANSVKIEAMNSNYANDVWTQKYSTTTNTIEHVSISMSHTPVGASNSGSGFNKLRFTLSNFANTQFRISQIGIYNYGSLGLRETYMSRGVDDYVYRHITPATNDTYSLGNSSYKWKNIYVGTLNGTTIPANPKFTDTLYTAANSAPGKVATNSAQGSSTNYARQDHTHGIDLATGDNNGQVKIAGTNVSVKGLADFAYKDSLTYDDMHMTPLATKTYTDVIATANDQNGAGFFYLKYRGNTYNDNWHIKVRVTATVPGNVGYYTDSIFDLYGFTNTYSWYSCLNRIRTTSYRPIYYHSNFRVSETGYNNSCGGWLGFSLLSATNNTNSSYKRQIVVELLAYENCTVELQDTLVTPTNIPNRASHTNWYSSTNTSYDNFDAANYGLKQTGDNNSTSISNLYHVNGNYVSSSAIYRYQMLFHTDENTLTPLNNANNTVGTTKAMLTDVEFDPFKEIFYYNSTTTISASGAIVGAGALFYSISGFDLRYTFNCGTTLTANKPFYLVVTPTSNGKCKIASASPWTQTLPSTDDGKWYIYLGRTYSTYQLSLYPDHPIYAYQEGAVREIKNSVRLNDLLVTGGAKFLNTISANISGSAGTVNGHTVNSDVPANAIFTDTTYSNATTSAAGLMSSGDKTKLDGLTDLEWSLVGTV